MLDTYIYKVKNRPESIPISDTLPFDDIPSDIVRRTTTTTTIVSTTAATASAS